MNTDLITNTHNLARIFAGGAVHFPPLNFWRFADGEGMEPLLLAGHEGGVSAAQFSQDHRFLVTGGRDHGVRVWNLTSSSFTAAPLALNDAVDKFGLDPGSRWLATKGSDHTVIVSDLAAPDPSANPIVLRGHGANVSGSAVSPDNHWLATSSADGTVRLWDMNSANPSAGAKVLRDSNWHMVFSADNRWLFTLSSAENRTTIHMWDVSAADPSVDSKVSSTADSGWSSPYLSPDNHWMIDFRENRTWDVSGLDFRSISLKKGLSLSPDGVWIVSWDDAMTTLTRLRGRELPHTYELKQANTPFVFSPDHRWLFSRRDEKFVMWDLKASNPAAAARILETDVGLSIGRAVFSPDGNWLAASGQGDSALLWNLKDLNSKSLVLKTSEGLGNATVN